jgi:hypothetical protein
MRQLLWQAICLVRLVHGDHVRNVTNLWSTHTSAGKQVQSGAWRVSGPKLDGNAIVQCGSNYTRMDPDMGFQNGDTGDDMGHGSSHPRQRSHRAYWSKSSVDTGFHAMWYTFTMPPLM